MTSFKDSFFENVYAENVAGMNTKNATQTNFGIYGLLLVKVQFDGFSDVTFPASFSFNLL